MGVKITTSYINLYERTLYKNKKDLEKDEGLLQKSLDECKNKFQKAMYLPLAIHLMKERKRLIGLSLWEKVQLKGLIGQQRAFKKLLTRWGVPLD